MSCQTDLHQAIPKSKCAGKVWLNEDEKPLRTNTNSEQNIKDVFFGGELQFLSLEFLRTCTELLDIGCSTLSSNEPSSLCSSSYTLNLLYETMRKDMGVSENEGPYFAAWCPIFLPLFVSPRLHTIHPLQRMWTNPRNSTISQELHRAVNSLEMQAKIPTNKCKCVVHVTILSPGASCPTGTNGRKRGGSIWRNSSSSCDASTRFILLAMFLRKMLNTCHDICIATFHLSAEHEEIYGVWQDSCQDNFPAGLHAFLQLMETKPNS